MTKTLMSADDFKNFREHLELKQVEFGKWLTDRTGKKVPYTAPEISTFENERRPVPGIVQAVIYKYLLDLELERNV